ncbi:hypothetical protein MSG28_015231 [Choristoneura fumiferana]|uniref:Uncharacterized protein n=1 Tax=Choristoneura fumiferana TaxID=7141 RepID=A0ACC0KZC2_CHOFU|nr:hypothetical protein MSG28_015231 [Choristoneura fumiferana]
MAAVKLAACAHLDLWLGGSLGGRTLCKSARIATTILLANPAVKQQCLHCCVSAWRAHSPLRHVAGLLPTRRLLFLLEAHQDVCKYTITNSIEISPAVPSGAWIAVATCD